MTEHLRGRWSSRCSLQPTGLAGAADPERAYIETILPAKLALQADYAARATLWTDLAVLGRTLRVLLSR